MSIFVAAPLSPNDPMVLRLNPPDGGPPLDEDQLVPMPARLDFEDVLDGLNPLHHLPGVGSVYRAVTGDEIQPAMRVLGAAVLGGPLGMILAALGSLAEELIAMGPAQGAALYAAREQHDTSLIG